MIEIMMLQKRTDFQITPGIFLKKAFKMETFVTSIAAAVEKPPVYYYFWFLILINICNFSSLFLYVLYLSKGFLFYFTFYFLVELCCFIHF